jgi:hypothetical protein
MQNPNGLMKLKNRYIELRIFKFKKIIAKIAAIQGVK